MVGQLGQAGRSEEGLRLEQLEHLELAVLLSEGERGQGRGQEVSVHGVGTGPGRAAHALKDLLRFLISLTTAM